MVGKIVFSTNLRQERGLACCIQSRVGALGVSTAGQRQAGGQSERNVVLGFRELIYLARPLAFLLSGMTCVVRNNGGVELRLSCAFKQLRGGSGLRLGSAALGAVR